VEAPGQLPSLSPPPPLKSGLASYLSKLGHISSSLLFSSQVRRTLIDFDNFRQTCCLESKQSKRGLFSATHLSCIGTSFRNRKQTLRLFVIVIGFAQLVEMYSTHTHTHTHTRLTALCPGLPG